jgi:ABC-type transport system involved in multi-copper enzyme maturation permease subunit
MPSLPFSITESNPILARELRARTRRSGGVITLTLYLLLLIGIAAIVWSINRSVGAALNIEEAANSKIGANIFEGVISAMTFLVAFIVPGLTAPSIAGERDRQTLIPLQVSLLTPSKIVLGKLAAALAFMLLLIFASAPLLGVSYVIGGITMGSIVRGLLAVVIVTILFGAIGIACSAIPKRTASAVVMAYAATIIIVFLGPGIAALLGWMTVPIVGAVFGFSHPYAFVADFTYSDSSNTSAGPMSFFNEASASFSQHSFLPAWSLQLMFYAFVTFGCLWLAAKRLRTPAETER